MVRWYYQRKTFTWATLRSNGTSGQGLYIVKKLLLMMNCTNPIIEIHDHNFMITIEETAGAAVTSFRFNLSDGTSYDLIYACYGVKNGELKSAAGGFKYFTSADIGSYWNNLNTELEAIPINESELP